jgi:hypothetical protein
MAGIPDTRNEDGRLDRLPRSLASPPPGKEPARVRRATFTMPKSPYAVWMATRLATMGVAACVPLLIAGVFGIGTLFPFVFAVGFFGFALLKAQAEVPELNGRTRFRIFFLDPVGEKYAPMECPGCGQSIFEPPASSEYEPENAQTIVQRIFPPRGCGNCGHDLTKPLDG